MADTDDIAEDAPAAKPVEAAVEPAEAVVETPRDERRDSIDPATGTLTDEAVAIRRAEREAGE